MAAKWVRLRRAPGPSLAAVLRRGHQTLILPFRSFFCGRSSSSASVNKVSFLRDCPAPFAFPSAPFLPGLRLSSWIGRQSLRGAPCCLLPILAFTYWVPPHVQFSILVTPGVSGACAELRPGLLPLIRLVAAPATSFC